VKHAERLTFGNKLATEGAEGVGLWKLWGVVLDNEAHRYLGGLIMYELMVGLHVRMKGTMSTFFFVGEVLVTAGLEVVKSWSKHKKLGLLNN
jgi:hypothetical protein